MPIKEKIIIIGSGHSGGMASILLRKEGFSGEITIIGNEKLLPYERPQLSKLYLKNEIEFKRLQLRSEKFYKDNKINLVLGTEIEEIDRNNSHVSAKDGRYFPYSKLIIATGSNNKKLPLKESKKINYLRTKSEAEKIKSYMDKSKSLTIIGSGFIGLELASVSIEQKINTRIIELTNRVMSRSVSDVMSDFFYKKHLSEGGEILLGTKIENLSYKEEKIEVLLPNGNKISSDFLIIGIGAEPNTKIAEEAGLLCNDGISVDKNCRTSDKNIFAIGDCSNQYNNYFGENIRLESVDNAVNQAKIVAGFLTNKLIKYDHVPWFWTKQYNLNLQIAGFIKNEYKKKIVGSMKKNKFAIYHISNNKLKAVESVNNPKSFIRGKKLIQSQERIKNDSLI